MLISVLKGILRRPPAGDEPIARERHEPYFDALLLATHIRERSEELRERFLYHPALVHLET